MTWRDVGNLRGEMGATGPQGATGETGPAGAPFTIYRTYATIALMEADFANVPDGSFVAIQSNVEDPDNAKLYLRGNSEFTFITDMSGATGIHGDTGETGATGKAGAQILLRDGYRNSSLSSTECPARPTLYGGFYVADLLADNAWATEVNLGDWVITRNDYNLCHIACVVDGKALVDQYFNLKGAKGDTGTSGEKGDTGASGEKGDTGDTGPAGPKGDTGDAFTYQDFTPQQLAGLKGDTGDTGPQGVKGDTGESGAKGDTGASGQKGDTGDTGPVNLASSLDTTDTTNAIKNAPVAIAIENIQTAIGTITSTQTSNLNLLGS